MDKEKIDLCCVDCGSRACRGVGGTYPEFCLTKSLPEELREESIRLMQSEENNDMVVASARTEFDGNCKRSRVEDVLHLAKLLGIKKIGIASCAALLNESRALARVLRKHGYEVLGVACKCGAVKKTDLGVPEECVHIGPNACNPVLQALILNREKTELNVLVGLCVGHDSLFYRYSDAFVTTLVAKDRLTGHNPVAPLQMLDSFWRRLLEEDPYLDCAEEDL